MLPSEVKYEYYREKIGCDTASSSLVPHIFEFPADDML